MADEKETTTGNEEKPPETRPVDDARADIRGGADEGEDLAGIAAAKATAEQAAAAAAGKKPDDAPAGDAGEKPAAAAPVALTPEQIATAARHPDVVKAILTSEGALPTIEELIKEVTRASAEEATSAKDAADRAATLEEALKKGREDDDWSDFGRLAAEGIEAKKQEETFRSALRPQIEEEVYGDVDDAVLQVFGDVIDKLTEEDKTALDRSKFGSDREFTAAVISKLTELRVQTALAEARPELSAEAQAQRNKATAELAAGDASAVPSALPGGSADKRLTGQESIGDLIRAGIGPLEDDSEI